MRDVHDLGQAQAFRLHVSSASACSGISTGENVQQLDATSLQAPPRLQTTTARVSIPAVTYLPFGRKRKRRPPKQWRQSACVRTLRLVETGTQSAKLARLPRDHDRLILSIQVQYSVLYQECYTVARRARCCCTCVLLCTALTWLAGHFSLAAHMCHSLPRSDQSHAQRRTPRRRSGGRLGKRRVPLGAGEAVP